MLCGCVRVCVCTVPVSSILSFGLAFAGYVYLVLAVLKRIIRNHHALYERKLKLKSPAISFVTPL